MSTPIRRDDDSNELLTAPLPEGRRTTLRVFREELALLKMDCGGLKRRGRTIPFLFTVGWSCITGALACAVGLVTYNNTTPRPGHNVWLMYFVGMCLLGAAGVVVLLVAWARRGSFMQDVDDVMAKIDRIDYGAPVEKE